MKKNYMQQSLDNIACFFTEDFAKQRTTFFRIIKKFKEMFDSSGEPVRAVVQLSLICADEKVSPNSLGSWQDAYDTAFGGGSKSLVNAGQKLGSLLNIGR